MAHYLPDCHIAAIEKIDMAACLRHNIALNQLSERIRGHEADITQLPEMLANSSDGIIANPPFHRQAQGRGNHASALAHHGDEANLED